MNNNLPRVTILIRWKKITDFPDYFISSLGTFKTLDGKKLPLPISEIDGGYLWVVLSKKERGVKIRHKRHLHKIVWDYFGSGVLSNYNNHIHHKDFNKQNNVIGNLELVTAKGHKEKHSSSFKKSYLQ